ncbi:hypothetical protein VNO77_43745 [Canavalia gladiata]|uniref:Transcription factor DIVARICATA n=1 Tax=Canavalia gladiata TaxID=3824 RepID=A0AAN9JWZ4_CANGL
MLSSNKFVQFSHIFPVYDYNKAKFMLILLDSEGMEFETPYPSCFMSNSNWFVEERQNTEWTKEENKKFESALAIYDKDTPDRWLRVASMLPGKTVFDVIKQYRELEEDVSEIEAGRVPVPGYPTSSFSLELVDNHNYDECRKRPATARNSDQERKKGVPWTEEEHRRFLMGLLKYGKGDWRNISRNFVVTKTPTQVASHAQKYYIRQKLSGGKDNRRRPSIHDITIVNLTETTPTTPSDQEKPLLFNESHTPSQQQKLNSMSKEQWINHHNDGSLMVFNPNYDTFMSSSSGVSPMTLKLQGQDIYDCAFHETYAKLKSPGFRTASTDFNNEAIFAKMHSPCLVITMQKDCSSTLWFGPHIQGSLSHTITLYYNEKTSLRFLFTKLRIFSSKGNKLRELVEAFMNYK